MLLPICLIFLSLRAASEPRQLSGSSHDHFLLLVVDSQNLSIRVTTITYSPHPYFPHVLILLYGSLPGGAGGIYGAGKGTEEESTCFVVAVQVADERVHVTVQPRPPSANTTNLTKGLNRRF